MCVFLCVCVLCEYLCCLMKINKNETTTLFGALNVGQNSTNMRIHNEMNVLHDAVVIANFYLFI